MSDTSMNANTTPPQASSRLSLWIGAIVFLLLVALVLFGLLEGALRVWWPQQERAIAGNRGTKGDTGIVDPAVGWSLRPGAHATIRSPEYTAEYEVSDEGFRDQVHHVVPKPPHMYRILLVGDSFTYGVGSNYPDVWGVLLEHELAGRGLTVDVIKAGVPAYDTRTELLMIHKLVPKYQPDLILMAFLPNDIFTNAPMGTPPAPEGEEAVHGHTFSLHSINLLQRVLFHYDSLYCRLYMLTARRQYFSEPPNTLVAGQYAITQELLGEAAQYAESQHAQFAVLSIPQEFQVLIKADGKQFPGIDVDAVDRRLGAFSGQHGFPWLAVMDTMVAKYEDGKPALYYRLDGHLTPQGNHVVGDWLTGQIARVYGSAIQSVTAEARP